MVGRITNYHETCKVRRGEEKGRFEFGGSTVILLFQKDAVRIDGRLYRNTQRGYETVVRMGEAIGESFRSSPSSGEPQKNREKMRENTVPVKSE